jgi:hypothetical protein
VRKRTVIAASFKYYASNHSWKMSESSAVVRARNGQSQAQSKRKAFVSYLHEQGRFMVKLRERGIYRLPNGRELVALEGLGGGYFFYGIYEWEHEESPTYESGDNGRLYSKGKLTAWDAKDLSDTGRTAYEPRALKTALG